MSEQSERTTEPNGPGDELIERVARELRRPVRADPDVDARVMSVVRARAARRWSARDLWAWLWAWLTRPRLVAVSPLRGLALAAGAAAVVTAALLGRREARRVERAGEVQAAADAAGGAQPEAPREVQFVLVAPRAGRVAVVGDFNDWDAAATPMHRAASNGVWTVVVPLQPGRYRYTFIVDGTNWIPDPAAPPAPGDDFGRPSSVVTVPGRSS